MFQSQLPKNSRARIFQSNREFSPKEEQQMLQKIGAFLKDMDSHGDIVRAEYTILYRRFIVIVMDDSHPLCGSVDDRLLQFIKVLEKEHALSLLDRMQVAYRKDESIKTTDLMGFKALLSQGEIDENTIVFNNVVTTNTALENDWEVCIKESWHKRFLKAKV